MSYLKVPNDREMEQIIQQMWRSYPIPDMSMSDVVNMLKLKRSEPVLEGYYMWVGINPAYNNSSLIFNNKSMLDLYQYWKAVIPYKQAIWCVEAHTEEGYRPHIHALVKTNKNTRAAYQISRLAKLFDISDNFVNLKISNNTSLNTQRRSYIKGDKQKEKLLFVERDIAEREENKIPHYISTL